MILVVLRVVLLFAVLSVIYMGLDLYLRWDRRRTLEEEYAAGAAPSLTREDYVTKGLVEYERSRERRALQGIFLLPIVVIAVIVIFSSL
ncbi:MAG: hypothetical protein ACFBSD_16185 [Paracoccaceae bacterium]